MAKNDYPVNETPDARQAFEDWYGLGGGRTLERLLDLYRTHTAAGRTVPTLHLSTLKKWSAAHGWTDRALHRLQQEAERAEAAAAEERKQQKLARLSEALALRKIGGSVLSRVLTCLARKDLDEMPLIGRLVYPEKGRPYRVDGLLDVLPKALKAIEIGQKLERIETGEALGLNRRFEALIESLIADMDENERRAIREHARKVVEEQGRWDGTL